MSKFAVMARVRKTFVPKSTTLQHFNLASFDTVEHTICGPLAPSNQMDSSDGGCFVPRA